MSTLKVDTLQHRDGTDYILSERNKLINGDFSVNQRSSTYTSTDSANNDAKYTLDRWQLFSDDMTAKIQAVKDKYPKG